VTAFDASAREADTEAREADTEAKEAETEDAESAEERETASSLAVNWGVSSRLYAMEIMDEVVPHMNREKVVPESDM
jgi:hypothetical protein